MKDLINFKTHYRLPLSKKYQRFGEGGKRMLKKKLKKPLITIITVVLNGEKYLEHTIKSILRQKLNNFEYIIVDGGSSDKTIEIIKKYEKKINYWVSEKDIGLYDAFNKGMLLASGNYIGIVNSDDVLTKNGLPIIAKYINKFNNIDFIFGSVKKHWGVLHGYKPEKIWYSWGFYTSHSTGFFIKRSSAKKVGKYNLLYKYHADYDYFYRMIAINKMKGMATKKNEVVGIFRRGGFSSTISYRKLFLEELRIRYNNGQNPLLLLILGAYKIFNHFKKKLIKQ